MPDKPTWKQRIRGLTGAGLLAVVCVCVSAVFIAWKDPFPIHSQWPHLDLFHATVVLTPAIAFWWYYFTYHWRVALLREPQFWLILVLAFFCCLLMMEPGVRSAA
jgi:hypothetical protein